MNKLSKVDIDALSEDEITKYENDLNQYLSFIEGDISNLEGLSRIVPPASTDCGLTFLNGVLKESKALCTFVIDGLKSKEIDEFEIFARDLETSVNIAEMEDVFRSSYDLLLESADVSKHDKDSLKERYPYHLTAHY